VAADVTHVARVPHFCAGCPHARSTRVPEGSFAMAGIGCHSLRMWMPDSATVFMSQMGGEGANWIGLEPFVDARHVFQNLGDGTYCHSGSLAIRAAVAAKSNITFRILYNEATAMTGGQPVEGAITVPQITWQLHAEGVNPIAVLTDDPDKYARRTGFAPGVRVHDRDELDRLQRKLRDAKGVSAIIYDQVCATEKRRRRRRGEAPEAPVRVFINERVCEGCGNCVESSQCAAVMPVDTPFGRKRRIDQSACNVDLSCLDGFCPSFVTLEGAQLRRPEPALWSADPDEGGLPEPLQASLDAPCEILINGIGGSGVITVGAILGMAAHLEGKGCTVLDNTGIARKGGAVSTHVRLATRPEDLHAPRIGQGKASLVLACDMVVSAEPQALSRFDRGRTRAIVNAHAVPTLAQRLDPDALPDAERLRAAIAAAAGTGQCEFLDASEIAGHLAGDPIYANMVMLGFAWQKGMVPLALGSILRAIELNGTEVAANRWALALGRRAALDPVAVEAALRPYRDEGPDACLDALVRRHAAFLVDYQDTAYAERYRALVKRVREAEAGVAKSERLSMAVAQSYFRLLAIKDEYEVGRLYADGVFARELARRFSGDYRIRYHLAPPLIARPDPVSGRIRKRVYGPWMGVAFRALARMRGLRGTWLDPFGHTAERRMERRLIGEFEATVGDLLDGLRPGNFDIAVEIASLPQKMRGFGHVKMANVEAAKRREAELLAGYPDFS
jgi:indolepyruvate ferredoxin oxidoreductase